MSKINLLGPFLKIERTYYYLQNSYHGMIIKVFQNKKHPANKISLMKFLITINVKKISFTFRTAFSKISLISSYKKLSLTTNPMITFCTGICKRFSEIE